MNAEEIQKRLGIAASFGVTFDEVNEMFPYVEGPFDSTGKPIRVGDRVRYRGGVYTIKSFEPGGRMETSKIRFEKVPAADCPDEWTDDSMGDKAHVVFEDCFPGESVHDDDADEISVDLVEREE